MFGAGVRCPHPTALLPVRGAGSTTGWHCGTIQARGQSMSYPEGTVTDMTRTTVGAEPGDSGGAYISGSQPRA